MSIRAEKVASVIKRVLATAISDIASSVSAGLVTVTAVRLSNDLSIAKVYLSIYGGKTTPGKFITFLEDKRSSLRAEVGAKVRLRHTPDLRFFLDDTLDQMDHIQELLDKVKQSGQSD